MGAYAEAHYRVHARRAAALELLAPVRAPSARRLPRQRLGDPRRRSAAPAGRLRRAGLGVAEMLRVLARPNVVGQ